MSKMARRVPRHPMQRNTRASYHRVNRGTTSSATSCHGLPQSHVPTKASSSSIDRTGVARLGTRRSRPTSRMKSLPGRSRSPVCGGRLDLRPFCKPIHPAAACATEPWIPRHMSKEVRRRVLPRHVYAAVSKNLGECPVMHRLVVAFEKLVRRVNKPRRPGRHHRPIGGRACRLHSRVFHREQVVDVSKLALLGA
jgi:hypothetical protein